MQERGDDYSYRLLSFLINRLHDPTATLKMLKEGKWVLKSNGKKWFVKRYTSQLRFMQQERLTQSLLHDNFLHVLPLHPIHQRELLLFEGSPIGITTWLDTSDPISYENSKDREDALHVLKKFHFITSKIKGKWIEEIPSHHWMKKWKKRLQQFEFNIPYLQAFIQPYYLYSYLEWGRWSLKELKSIESNHSTECITHGDVAHHNFLRGKNGRVYIIDFDLMSRSSPLTDDLQYCNRILPYLDWSLSDIKKIEAFRPYQDNLLFFLGLMYPTDIFREWNRFMREDELYKQRVFPYLVNLTLHQFPQRMQFIQELHQQVKRIHSQL
ncbi:phosphotransferase [Rossellomorea aquimaris]|uniref:phosphotransferase n=1 Tax=Rossellomorea aquimaris TaxID=189382 RepID=UPI0007D08C24|nr:phosphotransferase [Rossellomorea aquimaris]